MTTPHNNGSFAYKTTNKIIKKILAERSKPSNSVQVAMPFVKATSTVQLNDLLGDGSIGFTLGIQALPDVQFEDIFAAPQGNRDDALVGYTYKDNKNYPVFATPPSPDTSLGKFFTPDLDLITDVSNKTPPPGITNLKVGRNRAGLSVSAELEIVVPSLAQLEFLSKVFLVPGCGMVIEWGQMFTTRESDTYNSFPKEFTEKMFPWYNRDKLSPLLSRLGERAIPLEEILNDYVFPSEGQYMWIFGRVGTFSTKGNADGSFNVTVKIVGPSEDQWAYSVKRTTYTRSQPNQLPCPSDSLSVEGYLTQMTPGGYNLMNLLDGVLNGTIPELSSWRGHVIQIANANKTAGSAGQDSTPNVNQASFADSDNAYFMTWRFFVNIVLNYMPSGKNVGGIKGLYKKANHTNDVIKKIKLIRPYNGYEGITNVGGYPLRDTLENYVGCHPNLRSYDASTLVIVNEYAASQAEKEYATGEGSQNKNAQAFEQNEHTQKFKDLGGSNAFDFLNSDPESTNTKKEDIDRGLLSTGVWLNHKAVISSLLSGETILQGISNLLNRMNAATKNYWALTLDPVDVAGEVYDYTVVDQNYKPNSNQAVQQLLTGDEKLYTFNKYLRKNANGTIFGSEVIDFSVDLDLPKLLFSQIATTGVNQPGDATLADGGNYSPCESSTVSDPNETLRALFGMQTITSDRKTIDITLASPPSGSAPAIGECTKPNLGTNPAGTGGPAPQPVGPSAEELAAEEKRITDLKTTLAGTSASFASASIPGENNTEGFCVKCLPCFERIGTSPMFPEVINRPPAEIDRIGDTHPTMKGSVVGADNARIPFSMMTNVIGLSTPSYVISPSADPGARKRYAAANGGSNAQYLEKEAAAALQKLIAHAVATNAPAFYISSCYRDYDHQVALGTGAGVAKPGSSPHGMGRAIDFGTLFGLAGGSVDQRVNDNVRRTSPVYKWLFENGPKFGWYHPQRLRNGGVDECWHFEYWGYEYPPGRYVPDTGEYGAVFVSGLTTTGISLETQRAAFKNGVGEDVRVFFAEYTQISQVKTFLQQHPKTPVFLYSAGARAENVNALINDPNLDKQTLFLIEPYYGTSDTRASEYARAAAPTRTAILNAIEKNGLPKTNVYVGNSRERGGGDYLIPGTIIVPSNIVHQTAPTYVGNLKKNTLKVARATTQSGFVSSELQQNPNATPEQKCPDEYLRKIATEGRRDFAFTDNGKLQLGLDLCTKAEKVCRPIASQYLQYEQQLFPQLEYGDPSAVVTEEYPTMNIIMRYVELQPDHMVAKIRCASNGKRSNAFGAAPGSLSIKTDMTLPGIAGLRVGELFWIDKVPAYLKFFGAFQIMSIEDVVGIDGWQTKIHAVFNYLGSEWTQRLLKENPITYER